MFRAERLYLSMDAVRGCGDCPPCPGFKHGGTYPTGEVLSASCLLHDGTGIQSSHLFVIHNQPKAPLEDEGQEEMFMKIIRWLWVLLPMLVACSKDETDIIIGAKDSLYYNILSETDRTVEVTYGDAYGNYSGDIVIPQTTIIDGKTYTVTTIGDFAFYKCRALTSVSMPSVTTIGSNAFGFCRALTSVSMPSITTIGGSAFYECSSLTSISMPSVTTIGSNAFRNCFSLASVFIPASCTSIDANPFAYCIELKEIVVDENCRWRTL